MTTMTESRPMRPPERNRTMFAPRFATAAAVCCAALFCAACNHSSRDANQSESTDGGVPLAAPPSTERDEDSGPQPDAGLEPEQVVRLQLEAFRGSDSDERAFDIALRFFVPEATAPGRREALSSRLKQDDFRALFDFTSAEYGTVEIDGDHARQVVLVQNDSNQIELYLFLLTRRTEDPHGGCWLTETIVPDQLDLSLPMAGSAARRNPAEPQP